MKRQLGPEELVKAIADGDVQDDPSKFIAFGNRQCVEGLKYDFRFSGTFLKAKLGKAVSVDDCKDPADTRVEPGETVFLLTEEVLKLPKDIKAELSSKRKLAHEGLLVLGGFCVDPGYEGPLVFGLHNLSSRSFPLDKGKKLIAAQFYQLSGSESQDLPTPTRLTGFPDELRHIISHLDASSNMALQKQLDELQLRYKTLREEFEKREGWLDEFKGTLEQLRELITSESQERQKGHLRIEEILGKQTDNLKELNAAKISFDKTLERHRVFFEIVKWSVAIFGAYMLVEIVKSVM